MPEVKVEVYPWLSAILKSRSRKTRGGRLLLELEIAEGETVGKLLDKLIAMEEKLRPHLFDPVSGKFTDQISIVVNDRFIDLLDGLETELKDGDTVMLIQAWSGG